MPTDIGPHDLTSATSHSPFVVRSTQSYFANPNYQAFDSAAGNSFWIGQNGGVEKLQLDVGNAGGTEITAHDLTSNTSHSPLVVSASSQFSGSFASWMAFDGVDSNYWIGTGSGVDWLKIDFGSGNSYIAKSYWIKVNNVPEPTRAPKSWTFEGSNDNSTWNVLHTVTNETNWDNTETRYYETTTQTTAYRYFRINITANNGDASFTQINEFYIFTTDIDTSRRKICGTYSIQVDTTAARAPKTWTLEGKNHTQGENTWVVIDTVTSETAWGSTETRTFTCDDVSTAYESFRLNITANNGDGTYTEVRELSLFVATGGPTGVDETVSDTISLSDSISTLLAAVVEEVLSDTITITDSVAVELDVVIAEILSDSLLFVDDIALRIDIAIQVSDALSLSDSINFNDFQIVVITGDGLTLSDSLIIHGDTPKEFFDRLTLTDSLLTDAPASNAIGDALSLSDSAIIVIEINIVINDIITLDDTPGLEIIEAIFLIVGDSLSLDDLIELFSSTNDTSYLRSYLNDVQGVRTPENIADPTPESPDELNSYLRRYLNDV